MSEPHVDDRDTPCGAVEVNAALMLGRLDGALEHAAAAPLRLFAARILRDTLMAALRQDGHAFNEVRFHAWFAGLATLSDAPPRTGHPPRVLCEAILTEVAHSSWDALAGTAIAMATAFLAPQDLNSQGAHAHVLDVINDARLVVADDERERREPLFISLAKLHGHIRRSVRFAPQQRGFRRDIPYAKQSPIDQNAPPLWAIELHYGECLRALGWLRPALPLLGLLRVDALSEDEPELARIKRADALRETVHSMHQKFVEAVRLSAFERGRLSDRRRSSRAPAVFELLAGFGPMRSAQIEVLLKATRLGVRGMVAMLESENLVERRTIAGSHLYSVSTTGHKAVPKAGETIGVAFSTDALNDFDASIAHLDTLLGWSEDE